jgi:hypothetical protein
LELKTLMTSPSRCRITAAPNFSLIQSLLWRRNFPVDPWLHRPWIRWRRTAGASFRQPTCTAGDLHPAKFPCIFLGSRDSGTRDGFARDSDHRQHNVQIQLSARRKPSAATVAAFPPGDFLSLRTFLQIPGNASHYRAAFSLAFVPVRVFGAMTKESPGSLR